MSAESKPNRRDHDVKISPAAGNPCSSIWISIPSSRGRMSIGWIRFTRGRELMRREATSYIPDA